MNKTTNNTRSRCLLDAFYKAAEGIGIYHLEDGSTVEVLRPYTTVKPDALVRIRVGKVSVEALIRDDTAGDFEPRVECSAWGIHGESIFRVGLPDYEDRLLAVSESLEKDADLWAEYEAHTKRWHAPTKRWWEYPM